MAPRSHLFVALYEGQSVCDARIIAASANPELVKIAAELMHHDLAAPATAAECQGMIRDRSARTSNGMAPGTAEGTD